MINDRSNEVKVKKYAEANQFTILANTLGALEYVKYCYREMRTTEFLKWSKGSDSIVISKEGIDKKIKIDNLK